MNKFSTLVRSISPFVKKKDKRSDSFVSSSSNEAEEAPASSSYTWDLTNIDVSVALKYFYKEHNPEKINTIDYILGQYVGEEVLMLQTLCERYKADEEDMQYYLDKGRIKKKDRKKPVAETKSTREGSTDGLDKINYNEFSWKLSHCDVGQSLKQLYKDHNPLKTPNITLLNEKTNEETINLLQQLCKRHNLTEADMQRYLDMFNKKKSRSSVTAAASPAPAPTPARPTSLAVKVPSRVPFATAPAQEESYTTLAESPLPGSRHSPTAASAAAAAAATAPTTGPPSAHPSAAEDVESETDSAPPPPPPAPVMTPKMTSRSSILMTRPPAAATAAAPPPAAQSRGPPPPPPPCGSPPGIARPPPPATKSGAAALFSSANSNEDANSVKSGMSRISMNHMRPVLAGGKRFSMGPVLRQINSRMTQEQGETQSEPYAATATGNSSSGRTSGIATAGKGSDFELEQMRAELEMTRQQMLDVSKESQEVMQMLKDSALTINTNLNSAAVTAITLAQQQQEQMEIEQRAKEQLKKEQIEAKRKAAAARAVESAAEKEKISAMPAQIEELTKQNKAHTERIKMLEDMERQLRSRCDQLQMKHDEMKGKMEEALLDRQDAVDDKEDLLQLISVMHSSPIAVKNILESFLNKLGQSTGSMSVMLGVSKEGAQLTIAERISEALLIKRQQGRELNNVLSPNGKSTAAKASPRSAEESMVNILSNNGTGSGNTSNANSRAPTPVHQQHHQSVMEGAKNNKVSEEEFKAYQKLNQQNSSVNNSTAGGSSGAGNGGGGPSGARRGNESPSMRFLQRTASAGATTSSTSGGPSSPKNADQLMVEQYELAKKFFDNQQANNRIAHQMEESNLAIQELKTEQMISKTLESNKKITGLSKTQLADDWIECYDPRTKKTYWHSPSLKKSTWHKPSANSAVVANTIDKSLHPTYLQMQQGGKATPNGMQVLTGTSLIMLMEGSSDYGGSLPPSRYNSPSLARGTSNALQQQQQHQNQFGHDGFNSAAMSMNNNHSSSSSAGYALGNFGSPGRDEQEMHATLNDIINRSKNTAQQQITQQQLYLLQQQQQQQLQQTQVFPNNQFQPYNTAPMSTDELRSHHSFDSLFESDQLPHYQSGGPVLANLPRPPSTTPSVTSELNSLTVSNSSRPSSASRARPHANTTGGGRNSRAASPQLPTRGQMSSKQQQLNNMPWVMAVDPKSQRKYWYNRETKVSTWRMPVELMN